jgi:hypothetical protein
LIALPMFRATGLVCLFLRKPKFNGYLKKEGMSLPSFLLSLKSKYNK